MLDMTPQELAQKVRDQILFHPETHDQEIWVKQEVGCGTTACVAGWACLIAGVPIDWENKSPQFSDKLYRTQSGDYIGDVAVDLLGLDHITEEWLFEEVREREEILRALDYLAKGDEQSVEALQEMIRESALRGWDEPWTNSS